ncbi:MAG: flagellar basal body rod protein FlgC [Verrucomicrobiota bacterium]
MVSNILPAVDISGSALTAERFRLDVIASNMANAQTTKDVNGGVYQKKQVLFESVLTDAVGGLGEGVRVAGVKRDDAPFPEVYKPNHPHANEDGMVKMPNVNMIEEMVDMMTATRSYEANIKVVQGSKRMVESALRIGQA